MAITSLAERKGFQQLVGTTDKVGPGAYGGHEEYYQPTSCAPFTSTSARIPDRSVTSGPDPSTYNPAVPAKHKQFPGLAVPFGVSGARLGTRPKSLGPGPGGYTVGSRVVPSPDEVYESRTMGRAPEDQKSDFFRKSRYTKPSIPKPSQAYGYGEIPGGILVKQEAPFQVVSGSGSDRVGPNHYTLSEGVTKSGPKSVLGGKFGGGVRQGLSNVADVPGPGHYNCSGNLKRVHVTPSSAFKSGTQRGVRVGDAEDEPGPGAQNLPSSINTQSFQRGDYQFFGSTTRRFKPPPKETKPGPGAYSHFPGAVADAAQGFFGWQNPDAQSTVSRSFSLLSNQGSYAFGATSRRFKHRDPDAKPSAEQMARGEPANESTGPGTEDEKPGPGTYDLPGSFRVGGRTSAAFQKPLRKSEKFGAGNDVKPPPGAYSPRLPGQIGRIARVPPKGEGFLGSTDRWHQLRGDKKPGPGAYTLDNGRVQDLKCPFSCSADRFANSGRGVGPGPGGYLPSKGDTIENDHHLHDDARRLVQ
eukprot:g14766.t1